MKVVAVTGYPGSGKTTFAKALGLWRISTDDYINNWEFLEMPKKMIEHIEMLAASDDEPIVIEGVLVARMLRKGWKPNTVIWIEGGDPDNPISVSTEIAFDDWEKQGNTYYTMKGYNNEVN